MANFPGPYQIRIFYNSTVGSVLYPHRHQFNLDLESDPGPGLTFADYDVTLRNQPTVTLETYVDAYAAFMQPMFHTTSNIVSAELWKFAAGTNNAAFYAADTLGLLGTSVSPIQNDSESILTFRTIGGGTMRLHWLHTVHTEAVTDTPPLALTEMATMEGHITGVGNATLGRDNTYPFACTGFFAGRNEREAKKRLRP